MKGEGPDGDGIGRKQGAEAGRGQGWSGSHGGGGGRRGGDIHEEGEGVRRGGVGGEQMGSKRLPKIPRKK